MNAELREAVQLAQGEPVHVEDPQTHTRYVLVREEIYDRVKALLEEDPPTLEEQKAYLSHMVKIAGWDDPEMDVYDEERSGSFHRVWKYEGGHSTLQKIRSRKYEGGHSTLQYFFRSFRSPRVSEC